MTKRRDFIKKAAIGSAGLVLGGPSLFSAKSYNNIIGANERIRVATIGLNGRGNSMSATFAKQKGTEVVCVCDVDERTIPRTIKSVMDAGQSSTPTSEKDCRKVLEDKSVDAIYIATPDHWHAPLTIMGCQAGKDVYVEKPLSHNPREGELAIEAARKYNKVVQMGAQRRSAPILTQGIEALHNGIIGRVYFAKTWYTNNRKATFLKPGASVPAWLDYELWQGPAPRMPYQEGLIHYDWHWFWHWGTGEALNNGTHEVDVARWGLGVDFPIRVSSVGGRYQFRDDWETPDTQVITMDYPNGVSLMWENRSSNGRKIEGRDRGIIFYGEKGSLDTGGDAYQVYDHDGNLVNEVKAKQPDSMEGRNTASPSLGLDSLHVADFLDAVRNRRRPNCDVELGYKSTMAMQIGNIAWRLKRDIHLDPSNGHIIGDKEAQQLWGREYEKGWEPKV